MDQSIGGSKSGATIGDLISNRETGTESPCMYFILRLEHTWWSIYGDYGEGACVLSVL